MPRYVVPLVRETTEYEWAKVLVDASSALEALEVAISIAENDEKDAGGNEIVWRDHGCGYGGCNIRQEPGEPIELDDEASETDHAG